MSLVFTSDYFLEQDGCRCCQLEFLTSCSPYLQKELSTHVRYHNDLLTSPWHTYSSLTTNQKTTLLVALKLTVPSALLFDVRDFLPKDRHRPFLCNSHRIGSLLLLSPSCFPQVMIPHTFLRTIVVDVTVYRPDNREMLPLEGA